MVGRATGRQLHALANNRDPRPVRQRPRRRSIGSQHALGRSRKSAAEVDADLVAIVDRVTRRLRTARRVGRTVLLRLRFDDFSRATRSYTLPHPTSQTNTVLATARSLLAIAQPVIDRSGLTLIGVTIANLSNDLPLQLCLPLDPDNGALIDAALDEIRKRYGPNVVTRTVLLARPSHLTIPLLPD
jgi:DNA polymerase-4